MKDLDFDELDRAVNSLMTGVPKTPEPKKTDDHEQTLTITPTIKDDAAPSFSTLDKTVSQINNTPSVTPAATTSARPVERTTSSAPLAARRGRFMDMVRPPVTKSVDTSRPASRQGTTIEPSKPLLSDIVTSSMPLPTPAPKESATPTPEPKSEWPDPIEMTSKTDTEKLLDQPEPEELLEPTTTPDKPPVREEYTPLATPFLTDTKVEKRPLGGAAGTDTLTTPPDTDGVDTLPTTDASAQLPADPAEIAPLQLPEELSGDLVAIESGANTPPLQPEEVAREREADKAVQMGRSSTPADKPAKSEPTPMPTPTTTSMPVEKPVPTGPISIPQQYHEEPSTGDTQSGSIYDTDTYHQALTHPAKKKSGWMWVIWIVAILLLGAGGGAALYFSGLV